MDGLCKNKRDWFQPSYLTLLLCIYVFERVLMVGGGFLFSLVRGGGDIKRRVFLWEWRSVVFFCGKMEGRDHACLVGAWKWFCKSWPYEFGYFDVRLALGDLFWVIHARSDCYSNFCWRIKIDDFLGTLASAKLVFLARIKRHPCASFQFML